MVLIIAEAGVNHNGDIKLARELIRKAKYIGADIIKFQSFKANLLATPSASKAKYQIKNTNIEESQMKMLKRLELDIESHTNLMKYCKEIGIEFLSSPFDLESIKFLSELGVSRFKIPSGEITNLPYLRYIGSLGKPIILSTGMSSMKEIELAINILKSSSLDPNLITILHCTSQYPAPFSEINLRAMNTISKTLNVAVGYSDHSSGIEVAIGAVSLGAKVIEKHLTLDKNMPGPDHKASLEPDEFKQMVQSIRNIEKALGRPVKEATDCELDNRKLVRKSIVAKCFIDIGEDFTEENLTTKRPGIGISPMEWDDVLSRKADKKYYENDLID
ncbi:N-acetylneuraminate synthase [Prochlorococcus sp. MIT 1011]|uniref:N-acetylneuraminate synthase n=1 Tax=Prochlorococcus sp. MIT 1011 TaxID=3082520 RepID=UPI0039B4A029